MHRNAIVAGLAAISASVVSAQRASTCTQATITIENAAQATSLGCDTVEGTLLIQDPTLSEVAIEGPKKIKNLVVTNATSLVRLSSTTVTEIEESFELSELDALSTLQFSALRTVGSIKWTSLDQLSTAVFGTSGVNRVKSIVVIDTFLGSLDDLNVASVESVELVNNRKLVAWSPELANITQRIVLQGNGGGQTVVNLPNLQWANDIEIRGVKEFNVPILERVNEGLRFDENDSMESFFAPNLTSTKEVSFTDNEVLTNITFPLLKEIDGAFTIQNNTALKVIDGFPELETVRGTLILRGSFDNATLPKLDNVQGQGTVTSTEDIDSTCQAFETLKSDGVFQGANSKCTSNNEKANEGGDGGATASDNDDDSAAGMVQISTALMSVAAAAVFAFGLF